MERDMKIPINEKGKGSYIVKSSGEFDVKSALGDDFFIERDFDEYLLDMGILFSEIYTEIVAEHGDNGFDSVGVWIDFDDGSSIENSIDVNTLEAISGFSPDLTPIIEFFRMTLGVSNYLPEDKN